MGAGNFSLLGMILLQARGGLHRLWLGIGAAGVFGKIASARSRLAFLHALEVLSARGLASARSAYLSSLLSMQRVMVVEPAIVFQG